MTCWTENKQNNVLYLWSDSVQNRKLCFLHIFLLFSENVGNQMFGLNAGSNGCQHFQKSQGYLITLSKISFFLPQSLHSLGSVTQPTDAVIVPVVKNNDKKNFYAKQNGYRQPQYRSDSNVRFADLTGPCVVQNVPGPSLLSAK